VHQNGLVFDDWVTRLEARHLADLRVPEVTRALRALSSAYVERRHKVSAGATLDSAGKRAAFALFYSPLHFLAAANVLQALQAADNATDTVLDLGCGTGAAGAAWALACGGTPAVTGIDRHPWAVGEARWTYRQLRLTGHAKQGDLVKTPLPSRRSAIIAAYAVNELPDASRLRMEHRLLDAAAAGARVLVLEPIARSVTPWWDATAARVVEAGGRADEWRIPVELPPLLQLLDRAAGLNHRELKLRTLYLPGR
jgi:protein-L-isoaspartate O-methyltransferase